MFLASIVLLLLLGPLLAGCGVALLYRRTGHGLVWQVLSLSGVVLAVVVLNLPVLAMPDGFSVLRMPLALGFGYAIPSGLGLVLALKRWPARG